MKKSIAAAIGLMAITVASQGQQTGPQPATPQLSKIQQQALKSIGEELEVVNQDFMKDHPGFHLVFSLDVAPDKAPAKPAPPVSQIPPVKK